jgi:hypothetical protein
MFLLSRARLCVFVVCILTGVLITIVALPLQLFAWNDYTAFLGKAAIVCIGAYIGASATEKAGAWLRSRRTRTPQGDIRERASTGQ